tara:strand:+ start:1070 stop:1291 length:222 start_codon:yes stop_codon:yes gene_type:complete
MKETNKLLKGKELVSYLMERFGYSLEEALKEVEKRNLIDECDLIDLKFILENYPNGAITEGDKKFIKIICNTD